ncbi:MAG: hypothetical protein KKF33_16790 [Alphaproteobacteria bacterium]|jgi:hypothetical protein|nr:hypothetical protein [Alphaproteobacteria bacterium]
MRITVLHSSDSVSHGLPRGWLVAALAIGAWALVALAWFGLSELFSLVSSAL